MQVLITGGAGFIGSHLVERLYEKGHNLVVVDNLSPQIHGNDAENNSYLFKKILNKCQFIKADICEKETWLRAVKNTDIVVHLAAETGTGQSMYEIERYTNVNIGGTALLLEILAKEKHQVRKVIIASSRAIYGEGKYYSKKYGNVYPGNRTFADLKRGDFRVKYKDPDEELELLPTDEESRLQPSSVYGITKQNQEQIVMCVCDSLGIPAVALRFQNVYGVGQSLINPYTGILSIFSTLIKQNKPINIFEDGKESRDFVYIDDVVGAIELSILDDAANNEIFNVGTGIATSVYEVAGKLKELYGSAVALQITGDFRLGDIRHNYADISKISGKLGFVPKVSLDEGLRKFTEWVNIQNNN